MNIFEQATRQGIRFETNKGLISTEDLWQLPLTSKSGVSLDTIAVSLYRSLQQDANVSFVSAQTSTNALTQLKFDVVKHIIDVRKNENASAALASVEAARRQKIIGLIEQKKDQELAALSVEALQKMV